MLTTGLALADLSEGRQLAFTCADAEVTLY